MASMNRAKLRTYAPEARRDFIQAMSDRAAFFGLTATNVEPVVVRGDVAVIAGRDHPRAVSDKREKLEARIAKDGFEQTMEAMAYTWFNRLVAIRFMELHGYLDHGYRVLSHPDSKPTPEILEHAEHIDLPGLKKDRVIDLKLEGNKESELYRLLLTAQCNALHKAMPFLFERIDDETELLLPDNLLHSDSLVRKLVDAIDEDDWKQVEVIGWLYQFYISEKKAEVIGKVVASADIPAATQLFTPNWIVKYLVQNTLGRQWLATYPNSALRSQMEFYIEPAEQTVEAVRQLKASTPESLNPESLTMFDPACGSCHILVEGYDLFKSIYLERGYRLRDIPALILQKNLFGLEIDDRAAQLGAFALMMKARADDRRIFDGEVKPNIISFYESNGLDPTAITNALNAPIRKDGTQREYLFEEIEEAETPLLARKSLEEKDSVSYDDVSSLLAAFQDAKTFGSLIQISSALSKKLPQLENRLNYVLEHGDMVHAAAITIKPLLRQARLLSIQYDAVVTNPPYMGAKKGMNDLLKGYVAENFSHYKSDLFAAFAARLLGLVVPNCRMGLMTPFTWMFIQSYEHLRRLLLQDNAITSLIQPEYHAFFESAYVPICTFVVRAGNLPFRGDYIRLTSFYGEDLQPKKALEAIRNPDCGWRYSCSADDLNRIPGIPLAYWVSDAFRAAFEKGQPLGEISSPRQGMATSDNDRFLRLWHEVDFSKIKFGAASNEAAIKSGLKWFPYNKGGPFRKWYGNNAYVVNWEGGGNEIIAFAASLYGSATRTIKNISYYFQPCITWSALSSGGISLRKCDAGFIFDTKGQCLFCDEESDLIFFMALLNSNVSEKLMTVLSPTLDFNSGTIAKVPSLAIAGKNEIVKNVNEAVRIAELDWNMNETSWDFAQFPLIVEGGSGNTVEEAFLANCRATEARIQRMLEIESANNRLFIDVYGLQREMKPDVPDGQITLYRSVREEDVKRLLSYAIGCIMGRFSLSNPGLTYAGSGNHAFDHNQYRTFQADDDGIVPLLIFDWGLPDDAANRIAEFIGTVWPAKEHLEKNFKFIADSLGPTNGEQARDTIRRYLSTGFYKHHLSTYKRRPIYWLFSSGKSRAFQCLVYLHRYNEKTLGRIRTEYVIPLRAKIASRIEQIEGEKLKASSTSHRKKLQKEQDDLKKQLAELRTFEEKLKHFADQRISLDLDDGVKANYGKFGDLLAEVKAVTGGKDDE
jgi:Eco57I restriction-modification methylase